MATRPDLSSVDAPETQYGIVFEPPYGYQPRDWAGPFASEEEAAAALAKEIGDDPGDQELGKVVEWSGRRLAVARFMDERGLHPNGDYEFEEMMAVIAGEQEPTRYASVRSDETYAILSFCETPEEAAKDLADAVGDEYLNTPEGVLDLDTGQLARPKVAVDISFD